MGKTRRSLFQERRRPLRFGGDEADTIVRAEGAYKAKQSTAPRTRGGNLFRILANSLIIGGLVLLFLSLGPILKSEFWYLWKDWRNIEYSLEDSGADIPQDRRPPLAIEPVNREFSVVIEKIGLSAPIVPNVSVSDPRRYKLALKFGVAHAAGTAKPGEVGNCYLFAHSSLDFWALGKYATVFNLLRKLEPGDPIVIFYEEERCDYRVESKEVVSGFDTEPLMRSYQEPILTLQTCDPPGTTLNRLIVTAKLGE